MRQLLRVVVANVTRMFILLAVGLGMLLALVIALLIFALLTHSGWHVRFTSA